MPNNIEELIDTVTGEDTSNTPTEDTIIDNTGGQSNNNGNNSGSLSDMLHEIGGSIIGNIR